MKYIYTLLFALLLTNSYSQSIQFTNQRGRLILGTQKARTASISFGDMDGDKDIDVVVANGRHWPEQNRIFFNSGNGKFNVSQPLHQQSETSYATELADFDQDGDLDIAVGNDYAPNTILLNDGQGNFSFGGEFGERYAPTRNLTLADIDLDGDVDILITNRGRANEICLNDGRGKFTQSIPFGTKEDSTIDVAVKDMDGDQDLDLILANRDGQQNYIYLNNGQLAFDQSHSGPKFRWSFRPYYRKYWSS